MKLLILLMYLLVTLNSRKSERLVRDKLIAPLLKRNNPSVDDLELFKKADFITDIIFIIFNIIMIILLLTNVL